MSKKLITNVGGVKIVADNHEEFIAKIKLALKCQHNHRIFKQEEFRLTRGEQRLDLAIKKNFLSCTSCKSI